MTPAAMTRSVRAFFKRYAALFQRAIEPDGKVDVDALTRSFADHFVEASPAGVVGGKNGLKFRFMIGRGFKTYRAIGTTAMKVKAIDVTAIDDRHAMARVTWDSRYVRRSDGADVRIVFTNVYMLQFKGRTPKIFAYVTGDEQAVLKANGVV